MNYQETIDYLFTRLPMFSRVGPAAFKKDLGNTRALCEGLGNPQHQFKSVHVGGTNGKGSVSHSLAAVFQTAGYKTGLYTSPHLEDFRERIRINGEMIPEKEVVDFTEKIKPQIDAIEPSFFEITVAMAFDYFAREKVDIAIIEVGLGGRFDSTNIITPELAVITQIGYDHMNMLGDTLEKIAFEKAGIIKPGVPVVIGEYQPETAPVFTEKAEKEKAPLSFASHNWQVTDHRLDHLYRLVELAHRGSVDHQQYKLDLTGLYQTKNICTILEAIHQLRELGYIIPTAAVEQALASVKKRTGLRGRWDLVHHSPRIILEVAHNEDGIRQMVEQLEMENYHHLHIILGLVKDKDPLRILRLLPKNAHYYFSQAHIPRALPAAELMEKARETGLAGIAMPDVNEALKSALSKAAPEDLILICGSIFLIAEVRH